MPELKGPRARFGRLGPVSTIFVRPKGFSNPALNNSDPVSPVKGLNNVKLSRAAHPSSGEGPPLSECPMEWSLRPGHLTRETLGHGSFESTAAFTRRED